MLISPVKRVQEMLDPISNIDILVCFMYFNVTCLRYENKSKLTNQSKINPNLLKLFMRHFPKLAKDTNYELESDEEDYQVIDISKTRKASNYFEDRMKLNSGLNIERTKSNYQIT